MRNEVRGILSVMMSGLLLGGPLLGMAHAVDGVKLIDQNKALAGNVTPGDTPGFPVTIQPGSYRLASNLTVPDENTTAIQITAENVSLDLNGFTIQGPTVCGGFPLVCAPIGTGIGVAAFENNITVVNGTVVNGTVRGMGRAGVVLGFNARVEQVRAVSNGGIGIVVDGGSTVSGNMAFLNNGNGVFSIGVGSTVSGNTALSNGGQGIVSIGSTVSGNIATGNASAGIRASAGSVVSGNTARENGGFGLVLDNETGYMHNVLSNNTLGAVTGGVSLGQNLCDGVVC